MSTQVSPECTVETVQRALLEVTTTQQSDRLQTLLQTCPDSFQQHAETLLPLVLQACDPQSGKPSTALLNTTWKALLLLVSHPSVTEETFHTITEFIVEQLHWSVFSHDWSKAKQNKLSAFFASHLVTSVRAHAALFVRSPSLVDRVVGLYMAVAVALSTSGRDAAALQSLHQMVLVRLGAVLEALGSAAASASAELFASLLSSSARSSEVEAAAGGDGEEGSLPSDAVAAAGGCCFLHVVKGGLASVKEHTAVAAGDLLEDLNSSNGTAAAAESSLMALYACLLWLPGGAAPAMPVSDLAGIEQAAAVQPSCLWAAGSWWCEEWSGCLAEALSESISGPLPLRREGARRSPVQHPAVIAFLSVLSQSVTYTAGLLLGAWQSTLKLLCVTAEGRAFAAALAAQLDSLVHRPAGSGEEAAWEAQWYCALTVMAAQCRAYSNNDSRERASLSSSRATAFSTVIQLLFPPLPNQPPTSAAAVVEAAQKFQACWAPLVSSHEEGEGDGGGAAARAAQQHLQRLIQHSARLSCRLRLHFAAAGADEDDPYQRRCCDNDMEDTGKQIAQLLSATTATMTKAMDRARQSPTDADTAAARDVVLLGLSLVCTLLLRGGAHVSVAEGSPEAPLLLACFRRWADMAFDVVGLLQQAWQPQEGGDQEGEGSNGRTGLAAVVQYEAAQSLYYFVHHNVEVPMDKLRLSDVAASSLVALLKQTDEKERQREEEEEPRQLADAQFTARAAEVRELLQQQQQRRQPEEDEDEDEEAVMGNVVVSSPPPMPSCASVEILSDQLGGGGDDRYSRVMSLHHTLQHVRETKAVFAQLAEAQAQKQKAQIAKRARSLEGEEEEGGERENEEELARELEQLLVAGEALYDLLSGRDTTTTTTATRTNKRRRGGVQGGGGGGGGQQQQQQQGGTPPPKRNSKSCTPVDVVDVD